MILVAVGVVGIIVLVGVTVTRMLRDSDDERCTDPYQRRVTGMAYVYLVMPLILLILGHRQAAILLALFAPVMFWLAKLNRGDCASVPDVPVGLTPSRRKVTVIQSVRPEGNPIVVAYPTRERYSGAAFERRSRRQSACWRLSRAEPEKCP